MLGAPSRTLLVEGFVQLSGAEARGGVANIGSLPCRLGWLQQVAILGRSVKAPKVWQAFHMCDEAGGNTVRVITAYQIESNFDHYALSKVGARGLMQVMPFWIEAIGKENDNLFDIATNLRYGCAILAIYLKREKKQIVTALARYHGSYPRDYYSRKVIKAWQSHWLYY